MSPRWETRPRSARAYRHRGSGLSRIRNADARFTLDRLVGIMNRLGARVEVKAKPASRTGDAALAYGRAGT